MRATSGNTAAHASEDQLSAELRQVAGVERSLRERGGVSLAVRVGFLAGSGSAGMGLSLDAPRKRRELIVS
jgi:hypothetical protein